MKSTLNCNGKPLDLCYPRIMGIINATPDSFYEPSRQTNIDQALFTAEQMITNGADIIDIGGMSTRPDANLIDPITEQRRIIPIIKNIAKHFPNTIISADTVYASTAIAAVEAGADMINDISAGHFDPLLLPTIAQLNVPYVLMHIQGTPNTMQLNPYYPNGVLADVVQYLADKLHTLRQLNVKDVIIDPGFGFGKTTQDNYQLLKNLPTLALFNEPIIVGLSRKRMIWQTLGIDPNSALNGTTTLQTVALLNGANILRTHDVKEAAETIKLLQQLNKIP